MEEITNQSGKRQSFIARTMLSGFLFLLPIIILIGVIVFLVRFVMKRIKPLAELLAPGSDEASWWLQILAFLIVCALLFFIGLGVNTRGGKNFFDWIEKTFLKPIPFYSTIRNIVDQFNRRERQPFQQVVLCDPYKSGAYMTGFVVEEIDEEMVVVYVPTAPNPTNGFVFHMNRRDIVETAARTEDAMASVIGMGAGTKKIFGSETYSEIEQKVERMKDEM